jgi:UDP-glucose 4-epimerase
VKSNKFRRFGTELFGRMKRGPLSVLVIGGAGYIGSHAAHDLKRKGHEAMIYDNLSTGHKSLASGFELIVGDIADSAKLKLALRRVDAVMHFAAFAYVGESVVDPRKYFQNNVIAGISLLNAVIDSDVRKFIFSSTCATYGTPTKMPITEDTPRLPVNPYGVSKLMFEYALEAYDRAYGLRFVALRYFNAAGADENGEVGEMHSPETHLIPSAFEAIEGERPNWRFMATITPRRTAPAFATTFTSAISQRRTCWGWSIWREERPRPSTWGRDTAIP